MIAIVDYDAGNLTSVRLALEHLGLVCEITRDPERVLAAERVIFPGVGAAGASMDNLRRFGLIEPLREVAGRGTPLLCICVGLQVILDRSEEDGGTECIGLIPGEVRRFRPVDRAEKIPQMGWNQVRRRRAHPLLEGIADGSEFYFVHSYYPAPADPRHAVGLTDYAGVEFASVIGEGNLLATQFHPERSGRCGLKLLENFGRWDGRDEGEGGC